MALQKDIPVGATGVVATYWKITEARFDYGSQFIRVSLAGFLNKTVRDTEGSVPVHSQEVVLSGERYAPEADRAGIYEELKRTPEFDGAVDV